MLLFRLSCSKVAVSYDIYNAAHKRIKSVLYFLHESHYAKVVKCELTLKKRPPYTKNGQPLYTALKKVITNDCLQESKLTELERH